MHYFNSVYFRKMQNNGRGRNYLKKIANIFTCKYSSL